MTKTYECCGCSNCGPKKAQPNLVPSNPALDAVIMDMFNVATQPGFEPGGNIWDDLKSQDQPHAIRGHIERTGQMKIDFLWRKTPGRFASGETVKVGKIDVARWHRAIGSKGEPVKYYVEMMLPGFARGVFDNKLDTPEACKERIESAVTHWFGWFNAGVSE